VTRRWVTRTVRVALLVLATLVAPAHANVSDPKLRICKAWRQAKELDAAQGTSVHSAVAAAMVAIGLWPLLLVVMLVVMLAAAWYVAASLLRW